MNSSDHPTFKVIVTKVIWTHQEHEVKEALNDMELFSEDFRTFAELHKELLLPSAPYPGLELRGENWECRPLKSVKLNVENWTYYCTVPDEYPYEARDYYITYEDLMRWSLESGWIHPEEGGGNAPRDK